ncbi:MAG: NAD-dependent epimerase/dehydratase family protein [Kiritimatiellae bacterium]|nr:NAD-dependent epimerase/dehydratase family protein [Kiritimatiellia bacterium]
MKKNTEFKRILVTGAHGFLGHHIVPELKTFDAEFICPTRADYELLDPGLPRGCWPTPSRTASCTSPQNRAES